MKIAGSNSIALNSMHRKSSLLGYLCFTCAYLVIVKSDHEASLLLHRFYYIYSLINTSVKIHGDIACSMPGG
jgi:hypothetical protein